MIDLHCHLDGSLYKDDLEILYKEAGLDLNDINSKFPVDKSKFKNLSDYLSVFDVPLRCLQSKASIEKAVYLLLKRLANQGLVYVEIRFAPMLSLDKGLTMEEVVSAALNGKSAGEKDFGIKANLILCAMRHHLNDNLNLETARLVKNFLGKGVVALDLAGDEGAFKTKDFKPLFDYANELGVPFTIHAGESDGASSVKDALSFGAKRIGHGVRAIEDKEVIKELKERRIALELCPTSEVDTHCINTLKDLPLKKFLKEGLIITINTDDMAISNVTLKDEFDKLKQTFNLTEQEISKLLSNSVEASFLNENEKALLRKKLHI